MCYTGSGNKTIYNIILGSSLQLSCFELAIWRVKEVLPPPFQEKHDLQLFVPRDGSCPPLKEATGILSSEDGEQTEVQRWDCAGQQ